MTMVKIPKGIQPSTMSTTSSKRLIMDRLRRQKRYVDADMSSWGLPGLIDVSTESGSNSAAFDDFHHADHVPTVRKTAESTEDKRVRSSIDAGRIFAHYWRSSFHVSDQTNINNYQRKERLFWSSDSAKYIYAITLVGLVIRQPIILYGVVYIAVRQIHRVCAKWRGYYADDQQARVAINALRYFLRRLREEGERAISGDYSRKVLAAYLINNCTAPGESYLWYVIRHKMCRLNEELIKELQEWKERRLGYEKSSRNLFS